MPDPPITLIISCGRRKQLIPQPARALYCGGLFLLMRDAVEATPHPYLILSAKYGLLDPQETIKTYDTTIGDPDAITANELAQQSDRLDLASTIVCLAPHRYANLLREAFPTAKVDEPLHGFPMGRRGQVAKLIREEGNLSAAYDGRVQP